MPNRPNLRTPFALIATLAALAAVGVTAVACSLNPQPLPPSEDDGAEFDPTGAPSAGGSFADAGASVDAPKGDSATVPPADAAPPPVDAARDAPGDASIDAPSDATAADGAAD